jgi:hypothetical protein
MEKTFNNIGKILFRNMVAGSSTKIWSDPNIRDNIKKVFTKASVASLDQAILSDVQNQIFKGVLVLLVIFSLLLIVDATTIGLNDDETEESKNSKLGLNIISMIICFIIVSGLVTFIYLHKSGYIIKLINNYIEKIGR